MDPHSLNLTGVLALVQGSSCRMEKVLLVGCQAACGADEGGEFACGLSEPVRNAVEPAVKLIHEIIAAEMAAAPETSSTP